VSKAEALHWLKQGVAFTKVGDAANARPLVRRALELDPSCEAGWMWLASLAESPAEALAALERALALNPANERARIAAHAARLQAGVAAAKALQKPQARSLLRAVVAAEPGNEAAWMWLASVAETSAEVAACLEKVLAINPANERARAGLARLRPNRRTVPAAAAAPSRPAAPLRPAWRCPLCRTEALGDPERCPECRALLCLDDASAFAGLRGVDSTRVQAALRRLKSVPATPNFATRRLLGIALLNLQDFAAAEEEIRSALRVRPDDGELGALLVGLVHLREEAEAARDAEQRQRKTVLAVDDSPTIRKLVTMTLERRGYEVWTAADASQAIDVLRERGVPDLILLDIAMPGMDGYQLCRLLRQDRETARLPIVMLSGKDGIFNKVRGRWAGSNLYLTKPFEPEGLLRVMQRYCPLEAPTAR
jgi:twitching motility two-component system response regulator PilG